jgi:PAS domain S-box-containing protein
MSLLGAFLHEQRGSILELFMTRSRANIAPSAVSDSQLRDHLPDFLDDVAKALQQGAFPPVRAAARSASAEAHGEQRLQIGYDLHALVREYGLLRDVIFERLEQLGLAPPVREMRILSHCISSAIADSVARFMQERQVSADDERRHLLGLLEQAPGFVCFLRGPSLVFELANSAYHQLVGHREILGKPVREALPEVEGQGFFELLHQVFSSGEAFVGHSLAIELQREPGAPLSQAFVDFIYQPIRGLDGSVLGILAQGHDVTELKRASAQREAAEAALRASEQRYRTLFESIDDGFCLLQMIFDEAGVPFDYRFLEANLAFESHTGLREVIGKTARELVPNLDPSWFRLYGRVALTGEPARFENHAPAMGGRWFDVYANRVGSPELAQVALVFKDVTFRKRVEQERETLLARESAARHQAEEASRLKDEFLATVSHELRTPLNAMLGWVHLLRIGTLAPEKHARALEIIERNARAQAQLIEDLLDVSRILAGKLRLQVETVDVHTALDAALETVRPAADAKSIALQVEPGSSAHVLGDPHRLQQVVWNLLSNAVKFTPKGGRVQVRVEQRDASVEIFVADTGKGIAKSFQPHVFERFRQEEGGSSRSHGGLGLGLSIVRQLVELHGGSVRVSSDGEGRGSTFTVTLPSAPERPRERPSERPGLAIKRGPHSACPPELEGLSVLIVDDEEDAREMVRAMLESCGACLQLASSVAEALEVFERAPPALLVSDIGMPDRDGYALIESVRSRSRALGGDVPAIALTAYARSEDRTRALMAGYDSHVPKPVEPVELLAVVASLAVRARQRRS